MGWALGRSRGEDGWESVRAGIVSGWSLGRLKFDTGCLGLFSGDRFESSKEERSNVACVAVLSLRGVGGALEVHLEQERWLSDGTGDVGDGGGEFWCCEVEACCIVSAPVGVGIKSLFEGGSGVGGMGWGVLGRSWGRLFFLSTMMSQ